MINNVFCCSGLGVSWGTPIVVSSLTFRISVYTKCTHKWIFLIWPLFYFSPLTGPHWYHSNQKYWCLPPHADKPRQDAANDCGDNGKCKSSGSDWLAVLAVHQWRTWTQAEVIKSPYFLSAECVPLPFCYHVLLHSGICRWSLAWQRCQQLSSSKAQWKMCNINNQSFKM